MAGTCLTLRRQKHHTERQGLRAERCQEDPVPMWVQMPVFRWWRLATSDSKNREDEGDIAYEWTLQCIRHGPLARQF